MLKLGNTEINSLGGINEAYLGRGRVFPHALYCLQLEKSQGDFVGLDPTVVNINIPSSGDYYIEVEIDTSRIVSGKYTPFFGRVRASGSSVDWGLVMKTDNTLVFMTGASSGEAEIPNFLDLYPKQRIKIKGLWTGTDTKIFINDVEVSANTVPQSRPNDHATAYAFVNGVWDLTSDTIPRADLQSNFDLFSYSLNGNKWSLSEGSGFTLTSDSPNFDISLGGTSNIGGVTDWNERVWHLLDYKLTVDIYGDLGNATRNIFIDDRTYKHEFRYVEDVPSRAKLWRYYGCRLSSDNTNVIVTGDSEGVFKVDGASDFTGGWHGDEELIVCDFFLDGVLLDVTVDQIGLTGENFKREYLTNLYETDNPIDTVVAQRISTFNINTKELDYSLTFDFKANLLLNILYAGMSSIFTVYNQLEENGNIHEAVGGGVNSDYVANEATSINTANLKTIDSTITYSETPVNWGSEMLRWNQSAAHNKIYYGVISDFNVLTNEKLSCFYKLIFS